MENQQLWNVEDLLSLYKLRSEEGLTYPEISEALNRSQNSVIKKYRRMNWEEFLKDPEVYLSGGSVKKHASPWTQGEMTQLDAYIQAGQSYHFISEKLGRGAVAVERKAQQTNWKAWRAIEEAAEETTAAEVDSEALKIQLVDALLINSRYDIQRLSALGEKDFLVRVNLDRAKLPCSFKELKAEAEKELTTLGFKNPEGVVWDEGTYVIFGDSHGKHTKNEMFDLLKHLNQYLKPNKMIHVGHLLDDDDDISFNWGKIDNLVVLAKIDELRQVQEQRNQGKFNYEVIRGNINLGDLVVMNQDMISDYVKTPIKALDAEIFDERVIVNCHRLEIISRCTYEDKQYIASPGSLCEPHVIKTIKQIDFTEGKHVKQAYWGGFSKYRRMRHMIKYWEQGLLVVNVDSEGRHTIIPCPIKKVRGGYALAYFDKMITSKGVRNPTMKIFVNGDIHSDRHDCNVLDIQEQIVRDYKPDKYVNIGDTHNYYCLNHHVMDRGCPIQDKLILEEAAQTYHIIKRCTEWAKDNYIICGNHERFAQDFTDKYPQFGKYLDFKFLCCLDELNYTTVDLKDMLKIGPSKFIHGDIQMYGQPGSKLEKASRTFGKDIFIGHIHYQAMRFGCYSLGLTGELDQDYNEPQASQWVHGFGLCNHYNGQSFMATIAIINDTCVISKTYTPEHPENWKIGNVKVSLNYEID